MVLSIRAVKWETEKGANVQSGRGDGGGGELKVVLVVWAFFSE